MNDGGGWLGHRVSKLLKGFATSMRLRLVQQHGRLSTLRSEFPQDKFRRIARGILTKMIWNCLQGESDIINTSFVVAELLAEGVLSQGQRRLCLASFVVCPQTLLCKVLA